MMLESKPRSFESGQPAQLSVMFSIDIYELIEQDAIVAFDDIVSTTEDKAWLIPSIQPSWKMAVLLAKLGAFPFSDPLLLCTTIRMHFVKQA